MTCPPPKWVARGGQGGGGKNVRKKSVREGQKFSILERGQFQNIKQHSQAMQVWLHFNIAY